MRLTDGDGRKRQKHVMPNSKQYSTEMKEMKHRAKTTNGYNGMSKLCKPIWIP